jgi:hypothetical protein
MITDFRDSNLIIYSFNSVLQDCAKQLAKFISKVPTQKIRKSNRTPWFTQSCTDLRNTVKSYQKLLKKIHTMGNIENCSTHTAETQYRAHTQKQCGMCNINILPLNLKVSL